jgi:hypothetical protein
MNADPDDPFSLDGLRVGPEIQRLARTGTARAQSRKWERKFIRFPWLWADKLKAATRIQTYRLLYEHWRTGGRDIELSNIASRKEGISARSKWNALAELERLGLVRIQRRCRQTPRVALLLGPLEHERAHEP